MHSIVNNMFLLWISKAVTLSENSYQSWTNTGAGKVLISRKATTQVCRNWQPTLFANIWGSKAFFQDHSPDQTHTRTAVNKDPRDWDRTSALLDTRRFYAKDQQMLWLQFEVYAWCIYQFSCSGFLSQNSLLKIILSQACKVVVPHVTKLKNASKHFSCSFA